MANLGGQAIQDEADIIALTTAQRRAATIAEIDALIPETYSYLIMRNSFTHERLANARLYPAAPAYTGSAHAVVAAKYVPTSMF